MSKRLYRSRNKMIAGVCAGLAEYMGVDPTVVRLLTVLAVWFMGISIFLYLIAWIIIPEGGNDFGA
ncbi:MAG: PspC domain-containing protein [Desulfitobacterium hafniense]|nr:PspC domain-containing protein [Desulfitobacterium hafniense]